MLLFKYKNSTGILSKLTGEYHVPHDPPQQTKERHVSQVP